MPKQFYDRVDVLTSNKEECIVLDADIGEIRMFDRKGAQTLVANCLNGYLELGEHGKESRDNRFAIMDEKGRHALLFLSSANFLYLGNKDKGGAVIVRDASGKHAIAADARDAELSVGTDGNDGAVIVRDAADRDVIHAGGKHAWLRVGKKGNEGDVEVQDAEGRRVFHFNGSNAALYVGTDGNEGDLEVRDGKGRKVFHLNGSNAALYVGAKGNEGDVVVRDGNGKSSIHLDGASGKVILRNGDAAEQFVAEPAEPGTVMVMGASGRLQPCGRAYDRRAVGVVAGAGEHEPGIVLNDDPSNRGRLNISMLGRAECKADAAYGPISVGDLLTPSPTSGHAMSVRDPKKAFGAVIGKALEPLEQGRGLVQMVVALQ